MPFYTFHQNNSGGFFKGPAKYVIVEADNANEANNIAVFNGLYFNGVDKDIDCECCGDRWGSVGEYDAKPEPLIYGKPPTSEHEVLIIRKEP